MIEPTFKPQSSPRWAWWITHVGFILGLAVVIARFVTVDVLREPYQISPGASPYHGPGPATALVFDLLALIPAMAVLLRRCVDNSYRLIGRCSHLLLLPLIGWLLLSVRWSVDQFAAVVAAGHMLAGACLLWAMSQMVRTAVRLRLVCAVATGLLAVLMVQYLQYRFVEVPENVANWNQHKEEIFKEHHWSADSFTAKQFERKLLSGELVAFFASPNTVAAVAELLAAAGVGIGIQRWLQKDGPNWLALPAVIAVMAVALLLAAQSKTSFLTPIIGTTVVVICWTQRNRLAPHARLLYWTGVAAVGTGLLAVLLIGFHQRGLFPGHLSNSLDFRWKYWIASAGIFREHPMRGVGWNNFDNYYLAHRLPEASEEIKDPHNMLVRFFVELGAVGGILFVAWLLRLAWELTRPCPVEQVLPPAVDSDAEHDSAMTAAAPAVIGILGIALAGAVAFDPGLALLDSLALLMKPMLFLLALVLASVWASMRSPHRWQLDGRPIPLVFDCLVTGLGLFLLHNLIDFALFEPGALLMFMTLAGSALGMACRPMAVTAEGPRRRLLLVLVSGAALIGWLAVAMAVVVPVTIAEQAAADANDAIASAPTGSADPGAAMNHYSTAARLLKQAAAAVPWNYDYVLRQAQSTSAGGNLQVVQDLLDRAKQLDPRSIDVYLTEANVQMSQAKPNVAIVLQDYDRIMHLNPNQVSLRLQFARTLDQLGLHDQALQQYRLTLHYDDLLNPLEPKRMSVEDRAAVIERIRRGV